MDRIEDLGRDALGLLAVDVGVGERVGQQKAVGHRSQLYASDGRIPDCIATRPPGLLWRRLIVLPAQGVFRLDTPSRGCHLSGNVTCKVSDISFTRRSQNGRA